MSKLGQLLKDEREKRGLTLHEIGMNLKINPKILKAIEDHDEAHFPAKTFLRGFIKSYAQYLRLDVEKTLQMFQEEFGSTRPEEPKKINASTVTDEPPQVGSQATKPEGSLRRTEDAALPASSGNRFFTVIGAIILLLLIAFVAKMIDKYQKESQISKTEAISGVEGESLKNLNPLVGNEENLPTELPLATPISGSGTETSTTTTTLPLGGGSVDLSESPSTTTTLKPVPGTTPSTTTTLKPVPVTTPSTTTTLKPVPVTTSSTTTTLKPVPVTTSSTTTTLKPVPVTTSSTTTTTSTLPKAKGVEVIVEALNKVSVKYSFGNGKYENLSLNQDQVHTFRSSGALVLEFSDGGAINIIVNGRDKGVPGTIGKSIKMSFP